jgi:hypothetical protein
VRLAPVLSLTFGLTLAGLALSGATFAEGPLPASPYKPGLDLAETVPPHPLPPAVTTDHVLNLPGRTLHFKATAGAIRLSDAQSGAPLADIAYTAYRLEGADPAKRPVMFAVPRSELGLARHRRDRPVAAAGEDQRHLALDADAGRRQRRHLARFRRPRLYRPARHRL